MTIKVKESLIISDVDGIILKHYGNLTAQLTNKPKILPGVLEKFNKWHGDGIRILLTTGRPEGTRQQTIEQLKEVGIFFDWLVLGVGNGKRRLLNDLKPWSNDATAIAHNFIRNKGIKGMEL